jgi:hypothetical protein
METEAKLLETYIVQRVFDSRKVNVSMWQNVEAYKAVRCRGSTIFKKIGSQVAVKLSALLSGRALLLRNIFSYLFLLEAESTPGS